MFTGNETLSSIWRGVQNHCCKFLSVFSTPLGSLSSNEDNGRKTSLDNKFWEMVSDYFVIMASSFALFNVDRER